MQRIFTALLFALLLPALFGWSTTAHAQWTPVLVDEMVVTYTSPPLAQRNKLVRMAWMADYRTVQILDEVGYFSRIHQGEYDCRRARLRTLATSLHAGSMGQGALVLRDERARPWKSIEEAGLGSFEETMWQAACNQTRHQTR